MKLLDFYASWCQPCKTLAPIVERVCKKIGLELKKIDVDDEEKIATQYNIRNIPTLILVDESNNIVWRNSGMMIEPVLEEKLRELC